MGTATGLLVTQLAGGAMQAGGSFVQAGAQRAEGKYAQEQANTNARIEDIQAADAIRRGDVEANAIRRNADVTKGAQRAAAAAGGADVGSGSAAMIQEQTDLYGKTDASVRRANAWQEAWGHGAVAVQDRTRGKMARAGAQTSSAATIATGGMALGRGIMNGGMLYDEYSDPNKKPTLSAGYR